MRPEGPSISSSLRHSCDVLSSCDSMSTRRVQLQRPVRRKQQGFGYAAAASLSPIHHKTTIDKKAQSLRAVEELASPRQFVLACAENHSGALRGRGVLPYGEREPIGLLGVLGLSGVSGFQGQSPWSGWWWWGSRGCIRLMSNESNDIPFCSSAWLVDGLRNESNDCPAIWRILLCGGPLDILIFTLNSTKF